MDRPIAALFRRTAAALLLLAAAPALAQTAVLHPSTITGNVGIGGLPVQSGYVSLSSNANFNGSESFTGSTFSVTVEAAQAYQNVYANETLATGWFALSLYSPTGAVVSPAAGGTLTLDLTRPAGSVYLHVDVTGGTLVSTTLDASAQSGGESYAAHAEGTASADAQLPMPTSVGSLTGWGQFSVTDQNGKVVCTVAQQLINNASYSFGADAALTYSVALSPASCSSGLVGLLNLGGLPPNYAPNGFYVYALGPAPQGYLALNVPGNGNAYQFTGINPGVWTLRPYAYFPQGGWLYLPNQSPPNVTVTQGSTADRDFSFDAVVGTGTLSITGSDIDKLTSMQPILLGVNDPTAPNGGPSNGGESSLMSSGPTYMAVLTPGQWSLQQLNMTFQGSQDTPSWWAETGIYGNLGSVTAMAGTPVVFPTLSYTLAEGQVVLQVVVPSGTPAVGISNPYIYAQASDAKTGLTYRGWANTYVSNALSPAVRLIAPPGNYTIEAYGYVNGSQTRFASSTIDLGTLVDTPTGTGVVVATTDSTGNPQPVTMTFSNVTSGGNTTVSTTGIGPPPPQDHFLVKWAGGHEFMDISTTASFNGKVELAMRYDPVALGLTPAQEASLRLMHWVCSADGSTCSWQKINEVSNPHVPPWTDADPLYFGRTSPPFTNPDTTAHVVYGVTSSFSPFALMVYQPAAPQAPLLNVSVVGDGTGSVSGGAINCTTGSTAGCSANVASGATVTLTATPANYMKFAGWSGDCTGTAPTCTVTMDAAKNVTATFSPIQYNLFSRILAPSGTVTGDGLSCSDNTGICYVLMNAGAAPITLTAKPDTGFSVKSWSGCTPSADLSTCNVTPNADTVVTIYFQSPPPPPPTTYSLMVRALSTGGSVTGGPIVGCSAFGGTCAGAMTPNVPVTLTASPSTGFSVKSWYGCTPVVGDSTKCTVPATGNTAVSVTFQ